MARPIRLKCAAQQYAWGKVGQASTVAQLLEEPVDPQKPYAELWMGTHPSGPSLVAGDGTPLSALLDKEPGMLGKVEKKSDCGGLPFLLKVLSVAKALSVQAHPDATLAQRLHAEFPKIYKDPNHKPEMAVALTDFQALCGFRSPEAIVAHLDKYPEFAVMVGPDAANALRAVACDDSARAALKALLGAVMRQPEDALLGLSKQLVDRCAAAPYPTLTEQTIVQLGKDFPGDVGIFAPLFLHVLDLKQGDAIFMGPNDPHAYLSGDILECMYCSDNVVRAGLTPKLKDVDTLVEMLTYAYGYPKVYRASAAGEGRATGSLYLPPCKDFLMETWRVAAGAEPWALPVAAGSPQIVLVLEGSGRLEPCSDDRDRLGRGATFFVPAGAPMHVVAETDLFLAVSRSQVD